MNKSQKIRHSKYKNTGMLFELLVRTVTSDVLSGKDDSNAIYIIKKYFDKNKPLGKEKELYRIIMETRYSNENKAKELIGEVLNSRSRLSNTSLRKEKYNLIKELQDSYNLDEFFKYKLDNYKELASIYKLFESATTDNELSPNEKIQCKDTLVERIISKPKSVKESAGLVEYDKQSNDLKKMAYRIVLEKFNEKYKNLNNRQKLLLREYIYNSTNISEFRSFVNGQIDEVKTEILSNFRKIKDKGTQIKVEGVIEHIGALKRDKGTFKDEQLVQLMRYMELNKEVVNIVNSKKETFNG